MEDTRMLTNKALQVFYGTIPLILVVVAAWLRKSMLLKDILRRLGNLARSFLPVRHPPQSGWLDQLGRLKGGRAMGQAAASRAHDPVR